MQHDEIMKKCEQYIDEHLEYPPTAMELAEYSGYSLYHFCHIFRAYFGIPVGEFISRKKLQRGAKSLAEGKSVTESALSAGYDTPSGFTKAFRKAYGVNATEYRKNLMKEKIPTVDFVEKDAFTAFGYCVIPDKEISIKDNGAYWKNIDFSKYPDFPKNLEDRGEIAAWIHPDKENGSFSYFFGFETDYDETSSEYFVLKIPKTKYAVFEVPVNVFDESLSEKLKILWNEIFEKWLSYFGKEFDGENFCFEYYRGEKAYIYIPIK